MPDQRDQLAQMIAGMPPPPGATPGGGYQPDLATRTRMPPMTPESAGTSLQIPPQFQPQWQPPPGPTWQPGPTSPFGGLDMNSWKDPSQPPQQIGVAGTGPTQQDLDILHSLVNGIRAQGGGL